MRLKLLDSNFSAGRPIAIVHSRDAKRLEIYVNDSLSVSSGSKKIICRADVTENLIKEGEIILSLEVLDYFKLSPSHVDVIPSILTDSHLFISKKLAGKSLSRKEIFSIIKDIVSNALN